MRRSGVAAALIGGSTLASGALLGYAIRGRSSRIFGPSVFRGSAARRAIALTFDDGPSEGTLPILEILDRHQVPATFFQCGANVRRLPGVARQVAGAGHEIGNHSDTHPELFFKSPEFIRAEFARAQHTLAETLGSSVRLMRPPFGVRWFGFRAMQRELGLTGVMWSIIGRDWVLDAPGVSRRVLREARNGAIVCLHDGRELQVRPDVDATVASVRTIVPALRAQGYEFLTVSQLLCPTN